jgi:hypothetical protein
MRVYQFRHVGLRKCCFLTKTGIIEKNFSKSIQVSSILAAGIALGEYRSSPLHYPLEF